MGEVYLAEHTLLKNILRSSSEFAPGTTPIRPPSPASSARSARRPSCRILTVEIYDYGRAGDGTFYYVMELLWGLTLDDLVQKQGPLPAARAVYLLRQVCDALDKTTPHQPA